MKVGRTGFNCNQTNDSNLSRKKKSVTKARRLAWGCMNTWVGVNAEEATASLLGGNPWYTEGQEAVSPQERPGAHPALLWSSETTPFVRDLPSLWSLLTTFWVSMPISFRERCADECAWIASLLDSFCSPCKSVCWCLDYSRELRPCEVWPWPQWISNFSGPGKKQKEQGQVGLLKGDQGL